MDKLHLSPCLPGSNLIFFSWYSPVSLVRFLAENSGDSKKSNLLKALWDSSSGIWSIWNISLPPSMSLFHFKGSYLLGKLDTDNTYFCSKALFGGSWGPRLWPQVTQVSRASSKCFPEEMFKISEWLTAVAFVVQTCSVLHLLYLYKSFMSLSPLICFMLVQGRGHVLFIP